MKKILFLIAFSLLALVGSAQRMWLQPFKLVAGDSVNLNVSDVWVAEPTSAYVRLRSQAGSTSKTYDVSTPFNDVVAGSCGNLVEVTHVLSNGNYAQIALNPNAIEKFSKNASRTKIWMKNGGTYTLVSDFATTTTLLSVCASGGGGGGGTTNLGIGTRTGTAVQITSSSGTSASFPSATTTQAGALSATDKTKLDGLANYVAPNHTGDVTSVGDGATTISNDAVTNAKLDNMAANTVKGRNAGTSGDPVDIAVGQNEVLGRGATGNLKGLKLGGFLITADSIKAPTYVNNGINGTTVVGQDVKLGGALTENTTIDGGATRSMNIINTSSLILEADNAVTGQKRYQLTANPASASATIIGTVNGATDNTTLVLNPNGTSSLSRVSSGVSGTVTVAADAASLALNDGSQTSITVATDGVYLDGADSGTASDVLYYNPTTKEITYSTAPSGGGGSVSVPLNQVPYGTGSGITSDTTFRFDNTTLIGNRPGDKAIIIGRKTTVSDASMRGLVFNNRSNIPGDPTTNERNSYTPIVFQSLQNKPELDIKFGHIISSDQNPGTPFGPTDTLWNEILFLGNNFDGNVNPNKSGFRDAWEFGWFDGGLDLERHVGQVYVPNLQTAVATRWNRPGLGNSRRPFTMEIENVNRALTNRVNGVGAFYLDQINFRSFESQSPYAAMGYDQSAKAPNFQLASGWNGNAMTFKLDIDSVQNLYRISRGGTVGASSSNLLINNFNRFTFSDNSSRAIWSYIGAVNGMSFGTSGHNTEYFFQSQNLDGGFRTNISGNLTSPLYQSRGHLTLMDANRTKGAIMGFRSDVNFYYLAGMTATDHASFSFNKYSFNKGKSNAKPNQQAFFGMDSESAATLPVLGLYNTVDSIRHFVYNGATPNSNITAKTGDVCYASDGTNGTMWIKVSGTNTNTGWSQVATGSGITTVGAFQNTTNSNGLSISGTDIRLHAATATGPGGWSLVDQELPVGNSLSAKKRVINTAAGTTTTFHHTNYDGTEGSGTQQQFTVGEGVIAEDKKWIATGGIGNQSVETLKDPAGSLVNVVTHTIGANYSSTELSNKIKYKITNVTAASYQINGKDAFVNIPTTASTTAVTLPEIVSGVPGANQVRIGDEILIKVRNANVVTFTAAGADEVAVDGVSGTTTSFTTTTNVTFAKRLVATDLNEWTIYQ